MKKGDFLIFFHISLFFYNTIVYYITRGEQQRFRKSAKLADQAKRGHISHSFEVVASLRVAYLIFHNLSFETSAERCLYDRANVAAFNPTVAKYAPARTVNPRAENRLLSPRNIDIELSIVML